MSFCQRTSIVGALLIIVVSALGCSPEMGGLPESTASNKSGHVHPTEGPHGGELIELGNEEYHAELLSDVHSGVVTVYILDASGKSLVSVEANELAINVKFEGRAKQFKLAASPDANVSAGEASRFTSHDAELGEVLRHEHAEPQLVITINEKQYRGKIGHVGHDHGSNGHNH